jgi:predicted nucleic acid-binding protein
MTNGSHEAKVFLDSVGLIALWNRTDQWHRAALEAYLRLGNEGAHWVCSEFVLLECGNAAARRPYRPSVLALRDQLARGNDLLSASAEEVEQAWSNYGKGHAAHAGIVDQVSFLLMERCGIREAFTNDAHFQAAGFEIMF